MQPTVKTDKYELWHGDCLEVLPYLDKDLIDGIITDPPYPTYMVEEYSYKHDGLDFLKLFNCRQFVFWTPAALFPLDYGGKRIWDKQVGTATQYEEIYERNGKSGYKIHRAYSMGCFSSVSAQMTGEVITGHASQKPKKLMCSLVNEMKANAIFDPFMGSGTTGVACLKNDRYFIGIEKDDKYFAIAAKRLEDCASQGMLDFE